MANNDLPSESTQAWLIESLAALVRARGHERLLAAPMILATAAHFPDSWSPTIRGAERMIQRAMTYARLEGPLTVEQFTEKRRAELNDRGEAHSTEHRGTAAWYAGFDDEGYLFGVEAEGLGDPELLVGTLCAGTSSRKS